MKSQKTVLCMMIITIFGSIFAQAAYAANTVVATIPISSPPEGIAYDSGKGEIFVSDDSGGDVIAVIDDSTNTVIATIPSGTAPRGLAYDSAKGEIFVANSGDNTVSVIDDSTNTIVDTITVGSAPIAVAYDSAQGEIFVANEAGNTVSVIDDTTNTVIATISVGATPRGVAYDSGQGEIFVANSGSDNISVINDATNTVIATIPLGNLPRGLVYDSGKGEIFVAMPTTNNVSVIDDTTNTVIATISVGATPVAVAYDSAKGEIFVANSGDNTVSVIDAGDPTTSSRNGGHVYYSPSIGNDYHNQYGGGVSINGHPFNVTNYHSVIPQQILTIGTPATFDFKIYDERGGNTVSHVGLYLHFKGDVMAPNADTWISWDKKDGIQIHDPNGLFANVNVTVRADGHYLYATFTLTPQKPMDDSSLIMRMWDDKLASGDVPIWGAIIIVDPNAPIPVQKVPDNQYGDYITLQNILDKDGYQIPSTLRHERDMQQTYSSVDINWVYDKATEKLTMIESDKSGNLIGSVVYSLFKKSEEPKVTDHDYVYIPQQLNRYDAGAEKAAMQTEAEKAQKYLVQTEYIDSTAPNFVPSSHAAPILGQYSYFKALQLYYTDHQTESLAMKSEAQKAERLAESLGLFQHSNFENLSN